MTSRRQWTSWRPPNGKRRCFRLDRRKGPGRKVLDRTNNGVGVELLASYQPQNWQTQSFHVLRQMDGELLPSRQDLSAKAAWLILRSIRGVCVALLDLLPRNILGACTLESGFGLDLWLWELVLSNEMLKEVVAAVTGVLALFNIASPPLEVLSSWSAWLSINQYGQ